MSKIGEAFVEIHTKVKGIQEAEKEIKKLTQNRKAELDADIAKYKSKIEQAEKLRAKLVTNSKSTVYLNTNIDLFKQKISESEAMIKNMNSSFLRASLDFSHLISLGQKS